MTMKKTELYPAGFGIRLAAMLIDNLVLSIALTPVSLLFFGRETLTDEQLQTMVLNQDFSALFNPNEVFLLQILTLIITVFFWVKYAGTPGKRWLGIRVVDAQTGGNLTATQSILRYVGYFLSALPMCLGFFWVLFDDKNQAWHDKIAGTMVIEDKPPRRRTRTRQDYEAQRAKNTDGGSPNKPKDDGTFEA